MSTAVKPKSRLGRGLSSLISMSNLPVASDVAPRSATHNPVAEAGVSGPISTVSDGTPLSIPVDAIRPNPHQPRKTLAGASIAELAASMKSSGIIQPLIVRKAGQGYELIAGHRRWEAAKIAGLTHVPAYCRDVDSYAQAQMALVENIQREDLNPIERAQAYRALMDQLGLTQAELASRMGEERSSIANYLRLLDLTEVVRSMIRDGRLSLGHAKLLAGVADILEQQRLAEIVISRGLSVRGLEEILRLPMATLPAGKNKGPTISPHLADLEKSLARQLGLRVQLRSSAKGRGRLTLHYNSLDQFDELLLKLGAKVE
jgi:ParB family transcriptional regulator, chromosome partitioning protein